MGYTTPMHFYLKLVAPRIQFNRSLSLLGALVSKDKATASLRAFIHLCIMMPFNQSAYWYCNGFFKHKLSHNHGVATFKEKIVHGNALWLSFVFWLPVSVALYTVVPIHLANLMLDTSGLTWAFILSYLSTIK